MVEISESPIDASQATPAPEPVVVTLNDAIVISPKLTLTSLSFRAPLAKDYRPMPFGEQPRLGDLLSMAARLANQLPAAFQKLSSVDMSRVLTVISTFINDGNDEAGESLTARAAADARIPATVRLRYPVAVKAGQELVEQLVFRVAVAKDFWNLPTSSQTIGDALDMAGSLSATARDTIDHLHPADMMEVVAVVRNFIDAGLGTGATP